MSLPTANAGTLQSFAYSSLPIASVTLSGSGTPGTGGASITGYAWSIVSQPTGGGATLSDATIAGPTFGPISVQGDYVLFLRVTDNLGARSASRSAITTGDVGAFVTIRARSRYADLGIPGTGEYNVGALEYAWYVETDTNTGRLDNFVVQDCTDVAAVETTGPNLDNLCDGSYATDNGLANGVPLHLHPLNTVDPATVADLGAVEMDENPVDAANPRAVNRDRIAVAGLDLHAKVAPSATSGNAAQSLCQSPPMPEGGLTLVAVAYNFADAGTTTRDNYVMSVYKQTAANYVSNTFGAALNSATITPPAADNAPKAGVIRIADVDVDADDVLSIKLTGDADAADQGSRLSILYYLERRV